MNSGMHAPVRELATLFNEGAVGMLSDGQLLDRFVERREALAFEAMVERYGPLVWGVCRRVLRDHHDAEDAFQATFLVLARKAASVMPREKLGNWLYGVALQTAMKARATRAKRRVRERPAWEITEPEAAAGEHADELLARLDREVARLPEKYRMPVILCELQGRTHRQAAEQLGWPVGTVSGRLFRARALLASRLSRREAPLSVGALGGLLAHDMARAGVPPELVRSTAQAASLSMAGKAVTAGVVSAEVAALTAEVLKTMLISKLKLTTAILMLALALAAGGTSLTYRAQATEPANQTTDSEKPTEESKPSQAVKDRMPLSEDQPRPAELAKEDIQLSNDPKPLIREQMNPLPAFAGNQQGVRQPNPQQWGGYAFTASRTGNVALAYNIATGEVKAVRLGATKEQPLRVITEAIESESHEKSQDTQLVALRMEGPKITRVALFDLKSGKWYPLDLDEPASGVVRPRSLAPNAAAYEDGRFFYIFSAKTSAWSRVDLQAIADDKHEPRATEVR